MLPLCYSMTMDLFDHNNTEQKSQIAPLAAKLRPRSLDDFVGQEHLVGKNGPLRVLIETEHFPSMIFWGPPGCGKTTLARIIAEHASAVFVELSAVTSGIKEVREVIDQAKTRLKFDQKRTILFIDEIHRFNKSQQDAFLPCVEDGTIILIGATTENPGFEVNAPLQSRMTIYQFFALTDEQIQILLKRAIARYPSHKFNPKAIEHITRMANGDARTAFNLLELATQMSQSVTVAIAEAASQNKAIVYDKKGDSHYDIISAYIKSMRGGSADGALYWLARMLKSGEDPMFIARRTVIFASEDIANADPFAQVLATSSMQAVHMIGMPEAQLILAHVTTYLANAPKSTAPMDGLMACYSDIEQERTEPVPIHLRNAANKVMKQIGYGQGYVRYEKIDPTKFEQQTYLPTNLLNKKYYDDSKDRTRRPPKNQ